MSLSIDKSIDKSIDLNFDWNNNSTQIITDTNDDNNYFKINVLIKKKIFPFLRDKNKFSELLIDKDSLSYISKKKFSEKITEIIKNHVEILKLQPNEMKVVDLTAGVGGNTISFCKNFNYVYAVELDQIRCIYLKNNLNVYEIKNCLIYNQDSTICMKQFNNNKEKYCDIVFIDPPWGGKDFKVHNKLKLYLSNISIEKLCNNLIDKVIKPKLICLKLPPNYDIDHFYKNIHIRCSKKIYLYDLEKMIIVVIIVD